MAGSAGMVGASLSRMELRRIGKVSIDRDRQFPNLPSPLTTSIIGKSIANHLHVRPKLGFRIAHAAKPQSPGNCRTSKTESCSLPADSCRLLHQIETEGRPLIKC